MYQYYSVFKRKEISEDVMTWTNLEDITISEISQIKKDKYCMIPLTGKFSETENRSYEALRSWDSEEL